MRIVYSIILYLVSPLFILHLIVRGFRNPDYWHRWDERFGRYRAKGCRRSLWVHAVSVGEVQAALPLIQSLQRRFPDYPLVITTTTQSARQLRVHPGAIWLCATPIIAQLRK